MTAAVSACLDLATLEHRPAESAGLRCSLARSYINSIDDVRGACGPLASLPLSLPFFVDPLALPGHAKCQTTHKNEKPLNLFLIIPKPSISSMLVLVLASILAAALGCPYVGKVGA